MPTVRPLHETPPKPLTRLLDPQLLFVLRGHVRCSCGATARPPDSKDITDMTLYTSYILKECPDRLPLWNQIPTTIIGMVFWDVQLVQ